MLRFIAALFVLLTAGLLQADEIAIHFNRPSRLLAVLSGKTASTVSKDRVSEASGGQALLPSGTRVKADDRKGVLIVTGDQAAIDELRRYVELFDVPRMRFTMELTIGCTADKYEARHQVEIVNNESWTMQDGATGMALTLNCCANDDGTATVAASVPNGLLSSTVVARVNTKDSALYLMRRDTKVAFAVSDPRKEIPTAGWTILTADKPISEKTIPFDPEATYVKVKLNVQPSKGSIVQGGPVQNPPPTHSSNRTPA